MAIRLSPLVLIAAIFLSSSITAGAQYFGRNKVQYQRFVIKVLTSEHFDVYYYPEEEAAVRVATRMAERWYARLSQLFKHELSSRQKLILYAAGDRCYGPFPITHGPQRHRHREIFSKCFAKKALVQAVR